MEVIAGYLAVTGKRNLESVYSCGQLASELGYSPRQTYRLMLSTATLAETGQNGISCATRFLDAHRLPAKYDITETGLLKKKLHASVIGEEPLMAVHILSSCQKGKDRAMNDLFNKNPDRNHILLQQAFLESIQPTGEISVIQVPKGKMQYAREILSYLRKEIINERTVFRYR